MSKDEKKKQVAFAALDYIRSGMVVGIGTGSTVDFFIQALAGIRHKIEGTVASSGRTARCLESEGIPVLPLNEVAEVEVYIDGADEATVHRQLLKGGGGALTQEKILAAVSRRFVCIVDASKKVDILGRFPLPIEVIPMARSYVAQEMVKLGGQPVFRQGFTTDNGNVVLDVHNLKMLHPEELEGNINQIPGVVTNGIFARRRADVLLVADGTSVQTI